jgi:hypothetical protein
MRLITFRINVSLCDYTVYSSISEEDLNKLYFDLNFPNDKVVEVVKCEISLRFSFDKFKSKTVIISSFFISNT